MHNGAEMPSELPHLPDSISGLVGIASNLSWSWNREARALFRSMSLSLWRRTRHNPLDLIHRMPADRLAALGQDGGFVSRYEKVRAMLEAQGTADGTWYKTATSGDDRTIAYFCAEFGLHSSVPIYSGGLGVLAGDHCKAASDLGIPLVGIGLMYTHGYFDQRLRLDGWQEDGYETVDHGITPLMPVLREGDPVLATVGLAGRTVHIGAWRIEVGRVPVYLLDTNLEANDPGDRELSNRLYAGGPELRLRQEWILGVGGVRVLRALGYDPGAWHANEGHAAFMLVERLRERIEKGDSFERARETVRAGSLFTTHTPVPAGHDMFTHGLITRFAGPVWEDMRIDEQTFFDLGRHPANNGFFHMTAMALRLSRYVNGVSRRHGEVSRELWAVMWPDVPADDVPIASVTNGVHAPTWMCHQLAEFFDESFGASWERAASEPEFWDRILDLDDAGLWHVHMMMKGRLLDFVHEAARQRWSYDGAEAKQLVAAGTLLNAGVMTIGFARRFATYKRADLIFRDSDRLRRILNDPARPVQLVFAGKAHPADNPGKEILQRVFRAAQDRWFEGRVAFLEDYDMHMARRLVQGVDLWLNVPQVPKEACGTSGMKAGLNGVPQIGTPDGWWAEGFTGQNGWTIEGDPAAQDRDAADAESLYELLENQVVPLFYQTDDRGVPVAWVQMMKHAIREVGRNFTASRMLKEYATEYYVPAIQGQGRLADPDAALAR